MPLRDHFHLPWSEQNPWEGFHSAWVNTMVRHLNGSLLPRRYRAIPQIHLGPFVETDVATFDQETPSEIGLTFTDGGQAAWSSEAVQTLEIELPAQDVFEVRIHDDRRGMRLVATIEFVSPGNKDRPESRQAFVTKCAAYLQEQVNVVIIDVVTSRNANLHHELLSQLGFPTDQDDDDDLYAVSYRNRKEQRKWRLDFLPTALVLGTPLPTISLWLASNLGIALDLEKSYEETCQVLRIGV